MAIAGSMAGMLPKSNTPPPMLPKYNISDRPPISPIPHHDLAVVLELASRRVARLACADERTIPEEFKIASMRCRVMNLCCFRHFLALKAPLT